MKKIVFIITMLLMGITASAQIVDTGTRYELHIGGYVLKGTDSKYYDTLPYGILEYRSDDAEEVEVLGNFIDKNKAQMEKKYDIVIVDCLHGKIKTDDYRVMVMAYSPEVYKKLQDIKERKIQEKEDRINSLNHLL